MRTRIAASAVKGLTRFVGRERELETLKEAFGKACLGQGQVVGIVGEAGVGKSRLLMEFRNALQHEEFNYLEGRCLHYGSSMPYLPILDIFRSYIGVKEGDPENVVRKKMRDRILGLGENLRNLISPLQELLSLSVEDEAYDRLQPKQKRERSFEAIRDLLIRGSQDRPLILAVEDLHWIDKTSEEFLDYMIGWLPNEHILILLLYRPEYTHSWGSKSYYSKAGVDQFSAHMSADLIKAILEGDEVAANVRDLILGRASGNPFFMEELTHSLLENGSVLKKRDRYVLSESSSDIGLPDTIQGIIAARMDRLEESLKRIMQVASVIGREFPFRILHAITDMKEDLKSNLLTLQGLEFIYEKSLFPELEYVFRHALTQEVAYGSLLKKRREKIHEKIGIAIEELYPERLEEFYEILAYHYARSDRQDKATEYTLLAGDQAASLFANTEATTFYEQALQRARTFPSSAEAKRWQIDAAIKLAAVGITRQDIERDQKNLEVAYVLAEDLNDEPRLATVLYWLGRVQYVLLNPETAIEYAKQSLEIADRLGDDVLAAPPVNLMGRLYWAQSDFVQAGQMMERSVEQMKRIGDKTEESTAAAFAGYVFAHLGDFDRVFFYADRSIQLAREIENPFAESAAYHFLGIDRDQRGEWAQAIKDYEEGRTIANKAGDLFRVHLIMFWEGRANTLNGNPARGRMLLEESLALAKKIGSNFGLGGLKTFLAECLLRLDEPGEASSICREAIQLGEESGNRWLLALALRTRGEIIARQRRLEAEKADQNIEKAIRLLKDIEAKPELARTYAIYAELLKTRGESDKAKEYFAEAIDMFRALGMTGDLAHAEQRLSNV